MFRGGFPFGGGFPGAQNDSDDGTLDANSEDANVNTT